MTHEARQRELRIYEDGEGNRPYPDWLLHLRDKRTRVRIIRRIDRVQQGNFGDHKGVGEGVFELRMHFGPGYRVYFAEDGDVIVVLLCGGDKSTQARDVERAQQYWNDYKERLK